MERLAGIAMEPNFKAGGSRASFSGATGLIVAVGVVVVLLIALPAYRWFFLISVGIGLLVAGILFLWYRFRPVREEDIENNKRPLGLG
jgi:Na+/melibiose symporter-like transporter